MKEQENYGQFYQWMETLERYLDGKLSEEETQQVEQRLAEDPEAQSNLQFIKDTRAGYDPSNELSEEEEAEIRRAIAADSRRRFWQRSTVAASLLLLLCFSAYGIYQMGGIRPTIYFLAGKDYNSENLHDPHNSRVQQAPEKQKPAPTDSQSIPFPTIGEKPTAWWPLAKGPMPENTGKPFGSAANETSPQPTPKPAPSQPKRTTAPSSPDEQADQPETATTKPDSAKVQPSVPAPEHSKEKQNIAYGPYYRSYDGLRPEFQHSRKLGEYLPYFDKEKGEGYVIHGSNIYYIEKTQSYQPLEPVTDSAKAERILKEARHYFEHRGLTQLRQEQADGLGGFLDTSYAHPVLYWRKDHSQNQPGLVQVLNMKKTGHMVALPYNFHNKELKFVRWESTTYLIVKGGLQVYPLKIAQQWKYRAEPITNPIKIAKIKSQGKPLPSER